MTKLTRSLAVIFISAGAALAPLPAEAFFGFFGGGFSFGFGGGYHGWGGPGWYHPYHYYRPWHHWGYYRPYYGYHRYYDPWLYGYGPHYPAYYPYVQAPQVVTENAK